MLIKTILTNTTKSKLRKNLIKAVKKNKKQTLFGFIKGDYFVLRKKKSESNFLFVPFFIGKIEQNKKLYKGCAYMKGFFFLKPKPALLYYTAILYAIDIYILTNHILSIIMFFFLALYIMFSFTGKLQKHALIQTLMVTGMESHSR
ncbi:MAG: hypothetical protein ABUK01_18000 [Leptospirales bacterium]